MRWEPALSGLGSIVPLLVRHRSTTRTPMKDRWLSVEEIAAYLGVSKDTIYAWIARRGMPGHKVGRLWKFKAEQVDAWVCSGGAADEGSEGEGP